MYSNWAWWDKPTKIKTEDGRIILLAGATDEDGVDLLAMVITDRGRDIDLLLTPEQADALHEAWFDARLAGTGQLAGPVSAVWRLDRGVVEPVVIHVFDDHRSDGVSELVELHFASQDRTVVPHLSPEQAAEFWNALYGVRAAFRCDPTKAPARPARWNWNTDPVEFNTADATVLVGLATADDGPLRPLVVVMAGAWRLALPLDPATANAIASELSTCGGAMQLAAERATIEATSEPQR
ncbi:hypothetical protein [Nocardia wallacei]|uniref:hypothetical protein n=1 Tax=Nocardia wallacei TaxID=480035 RepID=UPI0024582CBF|nr:hypothetical protein [Nocardia wallacei]